MIEASRKSTTAGNKETHRGGDPRECQGRLTCRRSGLPVGRLSRPGRLAPPGLLETPCSVLDQPMSPVSGGQVGARTESPLFAEIVLRVARRRTPAARVGARSAR